MWIWMTVGTVNWLPWDFLIYIECPSLSENDIFAHKFMRQNSRKLNRQKMQGGHYMGCTSKMCARNDSCNVMKCKGLFDGGSTAGITSKDRWKARRVFATKYKPMQKLSAKRTILGRGKYFVGEKVLKVFFFQITQEMLYLSTQMICMLLE